MNWRLKGLMQRTLSAIPGGVQVNDRMQQSLGGLRNFSGTIETKVIGDWLVLVEHINELNAGIRGLDYVEVGTGWMPVLPVCFSLAGACSCTTLDINRHLDASLTTRMLAALEPYIPRIAAAAERPLDLVWKDYAELRRAHTIEAMLEYAHIRYVSPGDARWTGLRESSVDVVYSNNVFEHVPGEVLSDILRESRRILRPGGISIHSANCADHYAYFDRGITFVNYLAYSEREWRFWNNDLQYQNRLRPRDFVELARSAGLDVTLHKTRIREELRPVVRSMRVAPEFRHYGEDELCATSVLIGGVKPVNEKLRSSVQYAPAT